MASFFIVYNLMSGNSHHYISGSCNHNVQSTQHTRFDEIIRAEFWRYLLQYTVVQTLLMAMVR